MTMDRNYEIAVAKLAGEKLSEIASRHEVSVSYAAHLAKDNAWMVERCNGRKLPDGLTARAAIAIEDALGFWPGDENKATVESRAMDILRSPAGRRVILKEIGAWLATKQISDDARISV